MDILMDRIKVAQAITRRVETERFGPVFFQVGIHEDLLNLLDRVEDAHDFFKGSPLSSVANQLEREVLVSSIYGTNTIEGAVLSIEETAKALDIDPTTAKEDDERRVANIKAAYDIAHAAAEKDWTLSVGFIQEVHAAITAGLRSVDQHNEPGVLRWNPDTVITEVGSKQTGGRYRPPQSGRDVRKLVNELVEWQNELRAAGVHALIRAPLLHLYFELIHPFWDGNGRVGRVLEATTLLSAGYRYAPFALARFYLDELQTYFSLFNRCRSLADRKDEAPNSPFVEFHLRGMLHTIKTLHSRVNQIVQILLFETQLRRLADARAINARQYAIVTQVLKNGKPLPLEELRQAPWYVALYAKRGDKTKQRDLARLRDRGLLKLDEKRQLWPAFAKPKPPRTPPPPVQ